MSSVFRNRKEAHQPPPHQKAILSDRAAWHLAYAALLFYAGVPENSRGPIFWVGGFPLPHPWNARFLPADAVRQG